MIFKWDVYLCGPTTFKGQEGVMRKAREILIANHLTINDPRENSTVVAMMVARGESRDTLYRQILGLNTSGIEASYAIVSCIDNQDTGTAWEMGFSCGLARYSGRYLPRITFSARGASPNALLPVCACPCCLSGGPGALDQPHRCPPKEEGRNRSARGF